MAYNNTFPVNYQPQQYYPQTYQPVQTSQMSYSGGNNQSNGLIWVIGESAAKSYYIPPNSTIALWDSENPIVYLKTTDASGMPSMKTLDYTIREYSNATQQVPQVVATQDEEYITRDEFADFESRIMKQIEKVTRDNSKKGDTK